MGLTLGRKDLIAVATALARLIEETLRANLRGAKFIWHGGEPLLAGIRFFQRAVELQQKLAAPGQQIINTIQTNGTLLNRTWASFLAERDFHVGVSLDGPMEIHDKHRKFPNGSGSHSRVMRGIEHLRKAGTRFGVIAVVTRDTVVSPQFVFDFFRREGIYRISFNTLSCRYGPSRYGADNSSDAPSSYEPTVGQYAEFLKIMFDLWISVDDPRIHIRQIDNIVKLLMGGRHSSCVFANHCHRYFTVDHRGDVYLCDAEIMNSETLLGNLGDGGVQHILSSSKFLAHRTRFATIRQQNGCPSCLWFGLCRGGCSGDYFAAAQGGASKNMFCGFLQDMFGYCRNRLVELGVKVVV